MSIKFFGILVFLTLGVTMYSQDEYNKPKKSDELPDVDIIVKSDSNVVKNTPQVDDKEPESNVQEKSMFKENLRLGGGFDLSSYYDQNIQKSLLYFKINPQATLMLSEIFEGGVQLGYTYFGTFSDINQHFFSAGPILRAHLFETIFLQVEGTAFYTMTDYKPANYSKDFLNFNAYVGGGYLTYISDNSFILTGIKVNLMKNQLTYNQIFPVPFATIHFGLK